MNTIGERIKAIRKRKNMTLLDMVVATGISQSALSLMENGKRSANPSARTINNLCDALGVSPGYLLDGKFDRDHKDRKLLKNFKKLSKKDQARMEQLIILWGKR
jgi:transcriptional regulator with XRE-family HTH domain